MPPKKSVQLSGVVVAQTELCSIDAERGILRYRGYDIADLAEAAIDAPNERRKAGQLVAQLPTIVARHHRLRSGHEPVAPDPSLGYAENFLTMLRGETPTEEETRAFEVAMILHAEHELNASTFCARVVAGTGADLHSAIVAAICALKGPTHGGANEAAMRMIAGFGSLEEIPAGVRGRLAAKQTLFGFGHPVYTTTDPRARILKRLAEEPSQGGSELDWVARTDA